MTQPNELFQQLKREILAYEGYKTALSGKAVSLGALDNAFPNKCFPAGALHEFITATDQAGAATYGFVLAIIAQIAAPTGIAVWISTRRQVFPPALVVFGIQPEHLFFLDVATEQEALWAAEECLKCPGIAAIVCEATQVSFIASRRFQLAIEQTGVTAFLIRQVRGKATAIASVCRWRISPLQSALPDDIPGIGHPSWQVELLKVKNGNPGAWQLQFSSGQFANITNNSVITQQHRKAG
jgi:protein ImuA